MIDVVAAVIKKNNLYFIAQRNRNKHFPEDRQINIYIT